MIDETYQNIEKKLNQPTTVDFLGNCLDDLKKIVFLFQEIAVTEKCRSTSIRCLVGNKNKNWFLLLHIKLKQIEKLIIVVNSRDRQNTAVDHKLKRFVFATSNWCIGKKLIN